MAWPAPQSTPLALTPQQLHHRCEPGQFQFETTQELAGLTELIGQTRAMDAVRFGAGIQHDGYNMFVLGPAGMGKRSLVKAFLEKKACGEHQPSDWSGLLTTYPRSRTTWRQCSTTSPSTPMTFATRKKSPKSPA